MPKQKHQFGYLILGNFFMFCILVLHPLVYWVKHLVKLNHGIFKADSGRIKKMEASVPKLSKLEYWHSQSKCRSATLANAISLFHSIKKRIIIIGKTPNTQKKPYG